MDMIGMIEDMHSKFGVYQRVDTMCDASLRALLEFRLKMLTEEHDETWHAFDQKDPHEVVDGLIDIIVIAIGTLDLMDVDGYEAFQEVMRANMSKEVGVKEGRPNPLGLPDLVKPEGWTGPDHTGNTGYMGVIEND